MKVVISYRDKYIRREIARYLSDQYPNCETEGFSDPLLAAKSVYCQPTDVVILGLDGIKLIPMLRKKGERIIIIILGENQYHRDEAYTSGADAYITLPLRTEDLFSAVEGTSLMIF